MKKLVLLFVFVVFVCKGDTLFVSDSTILSCSFDPNICKFVPVGMMKYCGQRTTVKENGNIEVELRIYHKISKNHPIAYKAVYEKNGESGFVWQNNDTVSTIDAVKSPIFINWDD